MYFNKMRPDVLFTDIRNEHHKLDGRDCTINPDIIADFRQLPFDNDSFNMVIFDPPHVIDLDPKSWIAKKYGTLFPTWQNDLKEGFKECMRVLNPNGFLIFKWNEINIKIETIINIFETEPLIGQRTNKNQSTIWLIYRKPWT